MSGCWLLAILLSSSTRSSSRISVPGIGCREPARGIRKHRISSRAYSVILPEHRQVARSLGARRMVVGIYGGDFGALSGEGNEETYILEASESRVLM